MEVLEIKAGARTVKMFCGFFRQKKLLGFFRELVSNHLTATLVQAKRRIERGRESEIKCVRAEERDRERWSGCACVCMCVLTRHRVRERACEIG